MLFVCCFGVVCCCLLFVVCLLFGACCLVCCVGVGLYVMSVLCVACFVLRVSVWSV